MRSTNQIWLAINAGQTLRSVFGDQDLMVRPHWDFAVELEPFSWVVVDYQNPRHPRDSAAFAGESLFTVALPQREQTGGWRDCD